MLSIKKIAFLLTVNALVAGANATEIDSPPLTRETLAGVWEAISSQPLPAILLHMEITNDWDSYLVEIHAGASSGSLFRLDSCEVKDGKVKLHFASVGSQVGAKKIWIEGEGHGSASYGEIRGKWGTEFNSHDKTPTIFFLKNPWTRAIGDASRAAEEEIRTARSRK